MAREDEYLEFIVGCDVDRLRRVWEEVVSETADTDWQKKGLRRERVFEYLILRAFELEMEQNGIAEAKVTWPFSVPLGGVLGGAGSGAARGQLEQIDGVIHLDGLSCLVESKTGEPVNVDPLAKLRAQLLRRPATAIGSVFSLEGFTEPASVLARFMAPQTVLLWHRSDIEVAFQVQCFVEGLRAKYRHAVEQGIPDLSLSPLYGEGIDTPE